MYKNHYRSLNIQAATDRLASEIRTCVRHSDMSESAFAEFCGISRTALRGV